MNKHETEISKPWNRYTGAPANMTKWTSVGQSPTAISLGFVATAILVFLFLLIAIFEHFVWPKFFSLPPLQSNSCQKHNISYNGEHDISIVMPGEQKPTHIAQLAPLPQERENIHQIYHII